MGGGKQSCLNYSAHANKNWGKNNWIRPDDLQQRTPYKGGVSIERSWNAMLRVQDVSRLGGGKLSTLFSRSKDLRLFTAVSSISTPRVTSARISTCRGIQSPKSSPILVCASYPPWYAAVTAKYGTYKEGPGMLEPPLE